MSLLDLDAFAKEDISKTKYGPERGRLKNQKTCEDKWKAWLNGMIQDKAMKYVQMNRYNMKAFLVWYSSCTSRLKHAIGTFGQKGLQLNISKMFLELLALFFLEILLSRSKVSYHCSRKIKRYDLSKRSSKSYLGTFSNLHSAGQRC